jgi:putative SOS response-associated peptidase YedK
MRYRIRPNGSEEEIPSKYNLYNARQESILLKKTWSSLIGRNHVSIPMNAFNEWVTTDSGKKIVQFRKRNTELFWVAGLFDIWENPENKTKLISFAIITTEPTDYIKTVGHDRCPVILSENEAIEWIKIKSDPNSAFDYLPKSMNKIEFSHEFTAV